MCTAYSGLTIEAIDNELNGSFMSSSVDYLSIGLMLEEIDFFWPTGAYQLSVLIRHKNAHFHEYLIENTLSTLPEIILKKPTKALLERQKGIRVGNDNPFFRKKPSFLMRCRPQWN